MIALYNNEGKIQDESSVVQEIEFTIGVSCVAVVASAFLIFAIQKKLVEKHWKNMVLGHTFVLALLSLATAFVFSCTRIYLALNCSALPLEDSTSNDGIILSDICHVAKASPVISLITTILAYANIYLFVSSR